MGWVGSGHTKMDPWTTVVTTAGDVTR